MAGWPGGIGKKAQLRPAKAGAGAWPDLGNKEETSLILQLKFKSTRRYLERLDKIVPFPPDV